MEPILERKMEEVGEIINKSRYGKGQWGRETARTNVYVKRNMERRERA